MRPECPPEFRVPQWLCGTLGSIRLQWTAFRMLAICSCSYTDSYCPILSLWTLVGKDRAVPERTKLTWALALAPAS